VEVGEAAVEEFRFLLKVWGRGVVDTTIEETYYESSGHCAGYFVEKVQVYESVRKMMSEGNGHTWVGDDLFSTFSGFVQKTLDMSILQISADVAMRFTQIYDDLPLLQTLSKVVTRGASLSFHTLLWEVLNDLIGGSRRGCIRHCDQREEMWLLKLSQEDNQTVVIFQCQQSVTLPWTYVLRSKCRVLLEL
jgi:hypothetical protein